MTLSARENREVEAANASGKKVVVFVHGLWLLANSWDSWRTYFEEQGYATVAADWPDDPATVAEAHANPDVFAKKSIPMIVEHQVEVIKALDEMPAVVGHSFGGLLTMIVAGQGLASVSVPMDPAPFRGVLPLPLSALKVASVVIGNPANRGKAVGLTYEQFRYGFTNAVPEAEAKELYEKYSVAGSGMPLFSAATANLNPGTPAKANHAITSRGPMLIICGDKDHTVPLSIARAEYKIQSKNQHAATEFHEMPNRGHSLTIDSGWREVADVAHAFVAKHYPA